MKALLKRLSKSLMGLNLPKMAYKWYITSQEWSKEELDVISRKFAQKISIDSFICLNTHE
jgi:preprotein translocase subunit Sec63